MVPNLVTDAITVTDVNADGQCEAVIASATKWVPLTFLVLFVENVKGNNRKCKCRRLV